MEKGTFSTLTPSPGAAGRDDQGWGDRCSRKSLQETLEGAGNASGNGCHEAQPSPGGQYSVPVGLSWSHGCWVAMILSSWSSKGCGRSPGGVGSWSGLLQEEDGSTWGRFCPVGPRSIFGISVCGTRGEIQRDQRNPEPNVALGRSRSQATGCHPRIIAPVDEGGLGRDRVWDDTQAEGQGLL